MSDEQRGDWEIEPQFLVDLLDQGDEGIVLLDCREREEYEIARIDGSLLIPMSELQGRVAELEPYADAEITVVCHLGVRSLQVVQWLRQRGFAGSRSLRGGIDRWSREIDSSVPTY
ncbi:putative adenylyltransferase/sulfurtransferase MoeZ [Planctomycetes bacterium Pan216]|uniref:Putative adenylyltransferase/sulfurtransferase MoeZ n=2 Tax=Kolteria novifilia TaxID=2527975 RepID=A0A518BB93_9BACT|nr:putative adenylyltransferase/sulfurtransferase MoeZ [Planctomycetes bacterium Pan216]